MYSKLIVFIVSNAVFVLDTFKFQYGFFCGKGVGSKPVF